MANHPVHLFIAPAPRQLDEIFSADDIKRLHALGDVHLHEHGPVTEAIFNAHAANADIIIGHFDLPADRLDRAARLRAIVNVEGNFVSNVDYAHCFKRGIRVLEPVHGLYGVALGCNRDE